MTIKKRPESAECKLDARQEAILRSVIKEHILSGEPIGSSTVSRGTRLDLSPASIRSVMAELEERVAGSVTLRASAILPISASL